MADPISVSDLPEYGPAMAEYQTAKKVAEEAGDPSALKEVDLDWKGKLVGFQQLALDRQSQQNRLSDVREKIKKEHPQVPEGLFDGITDPTKLEEVAKQAAEKMAAATPGGSWGHGAPATSSGEGSGPKVVSSEQYTSEREAHRFKGKNAEQELREANKVHFADGVGRRFMNPQDYETGAQ